SLLVAIAPADVLALDRDLRDATLLHRFDEAAEADFGFARLLLGDDRPEDQAEQQEQEPQPEVARYGSQRGLIHERCEGTLPCTVFSSNAARLIERRIDHASARRPDHRRRRTRHTRDPQEI